MSDTNDMRRDFEAWYYEIENVSMRCERLHDLTIRSDAFFATWQAATALATAVERQPLTTHEIHAAASQWNLMDNFPPVDLWVGLRKVILWDSRLKAHRIGHPLLENTSDCTHWRPFPTPPAIRQGGAT